jgi:hypothetical protein
MKYLCTSLQSTYYDWDGNAELDLRIQLFFFEINFIVLQGLPYGAHTSISLPKLLGF